MTEIDVNAWVAELLEIGDPQHREHALTLVPLPERPQVRQRLIGRLYCQRMRHLLRGDPTWAGKSDSPAALP